MAWTGADNLIPVRSPALAPARMRRVTASRAVTCYLLLLCAGCSFTSRLRGEVCSPIPPAVDAVAAAGLTLMALVGSTWPIVEGCDELECYDSKGSKVAEVTTLGAVAAVTWASAAYGVFAVRKCPAERQPAAISPNPVSTAPVAPSSAKPPGYAETTTPSSDGELRLLGTGTCFAVTDDGKIATSYHVVANAERIAVQLADETVLSATIDQSSAATDIAILSIDRATPDYLPITSAKGLTLGQKVFTIGFPAPGQLGWEPKFSEGAVSALSSRGDRSILQVSTPVQPGNSGGALLTEDGFVVGIIMSKPKAAEFYGSTGALPEGIAFAMKADYILPLLSTKPEEASASSRADAIARAERATCKVGTFVTR